MASNGNCHCHHSWKSTNLKIFSSVYRFAWFYLCFQISSLGTFKRGTWLLPSSKDLEMAGPQSLKSEKKLWNISFLHDKFDFFRAFLRTPNFNGLSFLSSLSKERDMYLFGKPKDCFFQSTNKIRHTWTPLREMIFNLPNIVIFKYW